MADEAEEAFEILAVRVTQALCAKVDSLRGSVSRSQFLRDAICDKLRQNRITVTHSDLFAPDRKGKGGPKRRRKAATLEEPTRPA